MSFRSVISGANVETAAAANCRRRSGPPVALDVAQRFPGCGQGD
ncbi:hypothetical protein LINPERHAP2_LOCUS17258 [Linum perenne]